MEYGNKTAFQDRCRLLLRNGRYPSCRALGYVSGLTVRQMKWRAEVLNEWLDKHPFQPLPPFDGPES